MARARDLADVVPIVPLPMEIPAVPSLPKDKPQTPLTPRMRMLADPSSTTKQRPPGRPSRPRALDMDESIRETEEMQQYTEALKEKQLQAAKKAKENKAAMMRLREQVQALQDQLSQVQKEREEVDRQASDAKAKLQKLQTDHSALQAAHSWTKSSLESALAAQEEYRKGYNSLRTAFKKAQDDLKAKEEEVAENTKRRADIERIKNDLVQREHAYEQKLEEAQESLKSIRENQKSKARKVVDAKVMLQRAAIGTIAMQAWAKLVADDKFAVQFAKDKVEAQRTIEEAKVKKTRQKTDALERMMGEINTGLVCSFFQTWLRLQRSEKQDRQQVKDMKEEVDNHRRKTVLALQWQMIGVTSNTLECCWRIWIGHLEKQKDDEQQVREVSEKLGSWRKQNLGQTSAVVDRLNSHTDRALLERVIGPWSTHTMMAKTCKARDQAFKAKVAKYEAAIKTLQDELQARQEELEDVSEELVESRKKNQLLRLEFKSIMDVQLSLDQGMQDFDDD